jgi:flagellar assembly factor FliW
VSAMEQTETIEEIPELLFAAGIPGFPDAKRFTLVWWGDESSPFSILASLDDPGLEFLVVPPLAFFPLYAPEIDDDIVERLGIETADDVILLVIVTTGENAADATANLLAPIIVNRHTREAAQAVLTDGDHPLRAPLLGD